LVEVSVSKAYECVQVNHHGDIRKIVEEWQKKGWSLHTYQAAGYGTIVSHYLLFEKESSEAKETQFAESSVRI